MLPNFSPTQKVDNKKFKPAKKGRLYKNINSSSSAPKKKNSFLKNFLTPAPSNKRVTKPTIKSSLNRNQKTSGSSKATVKSGKAFPTKSVLITVGSILLVALIYFGYSDAKRIYNAYRTFELSNSIGENANRYLFDKDPNLEKSLVIFSQEDSNSEITNITEIFIVVRNNEGVAMLITKVPEWIYIESAIDTSVDKQSIKNLYYIGDSLYANPVGYIIHEISNTFAISFDNYVLMKPGAVDYYEDVTSSYKLHTYPEEIQNDDFKRFYNLISGYSYVNSLEKFSKLDQLSGHIDSNLSLWEIDRLMSGLHSNLESEELYLFDMDLEGAYEDSVLSNGKKVRSISTSYLDSYIRGNKSVFQTRDLLREQAKVELLNGGEIAGAATRYSRRIRNTGMFVTRVDNSPVTFEKTTLYISNAENFKVTEMILRSLIPIDIEVKEGRPEFLTTGDLILVLGEDLQNEYSLEKP